MSLASEFVDLGLPQGSVKIEYQWLNADAGDRPLMIFLHEGLGSLSMWRDFPALVCAALDCRGLVYSRPGYGQSTPRQAGQALSPDFMHRQADQLLPALCRALKLEQPVWLFGHSDGASIALLYAAMFPAQVAGAIPVVFQHISFFLEKADEPDQYFNIPMETRRRVLALLKRYGVHYVFAGHYHRNSFGKDGELEMVTSGPAGKSLGPEGSGIRLGELKGTVVNHAYYSLGAIPNEYPIPPVKP